MNSVEFLIVKKGELDAEDSVLAAEAFGSFRQELAKQIGRPVSENFDLGRPPVGRLISIRETADAFYGEVELRGSVNEMAQLGVQHAGSKVFDLSLVPKPPASDISKLG